MISIELVVFLDTDKNLDRNRTDEGSASAAQSATKEKPKLEELLRGNSLIGETIERLSKCINENDTLRYYSVGRYITDNRIYRNDNYRDDLPLNFSNKIPEELTNLLIEKGMADNRSIFNMSVVEGDGWTTPSYFSLGLTDLGKELLREYKSKHG